MVMRPTLNAWCVVMNKCISCGRDTLYYADPNDYLYRSDINYCIGCCEEEHKCNCFDIRPIVCYNQDYLGTK